MNHPLSENTRIEYKYPHGCGCNGKYQQKVNRIQKIIYDRGNYFYILWNGDRIPQQQVTKIII